MAHCLLSLLAVSLAIYSIEAASTGQSPIDLYGRTRGSFSPLETHGFSDAQSRVELVNDGFTLQVNLPPSYRVWGAGLMESYTPLQFHLHWDQSGSGSEHARFGEKFPAELHLVTRKNSLTTEQAIGGGERDGLAVFGFFIEVSAHANVKWTNMIEAINAVRNKDVLGRTTIPGNFNLNDVLYNGEEKFGEFFRYFGSLTTAPYNEVVQWTVFSEPIRISEEQLSVIRRTSAVNKMLPDNFRAIQGVNGRFVQVSGPKMLDEQEWLLAHPPRDINEGSPFAATQAGTPMMLVIIIFAVMAVVCLGCIGGVVYLVYVLKRERASGKVVS